MSPKDFHRHSTFNDSTVIELDYGWCKRRRAASHYIYIYIYIYIQIKPRKNFGDLRQNSNNKEERIRDIYLLE